MIKLLTSPWLTAPIGALVYLGCTVLFWKMPALPQPPDEPGQTVMQTGPSWEFSNPEADQLMTELRDEKKALDLRKAQLDEMTERIRAERAELTAITQSVHQLQVDFDKSVVRVQEDELPNLKKLAKVYAAMSPAAASTVMTELDDLVVVKIMLFMKESETASILEIFAKKGPTEAKRAAAISERVRLSTSHSQLATKT